MGPEPLDASLDQRQLVVIAGTERRELDTDRPVEPRLRQLGDDRVQRRNPIAQRGADRSAEDRRVARDMVLELNEQGMRRERSGSGEHVVADPDQVDVVETDAEVPATDAVEQLEDVAGAEIAVILEGEPDAELGSEVGRPTDGPDKPLDEDV